MRRLLVHAAAWYTRRSFLEIDTPTECTCDCCDVIDRRPTEVVAGVSITCAPSKTHGDACTDQCRTSQGDVVLSAAGDTMDQARFCFFECKPAQGYHAKVGSACMALDPREQQVLTDHSGNAMDPAILAAPVEAPTFLQVRREPGSAQDHPVYGETTAMADAAEAQAGATQGDMKGLRSGEVAKMPEPPAAGKADDLSSVRDILNDAKQSAEYAQEAGIEAGKAEAAVIEGRKQALEGGVKAGKDAMEAVKTADIGAAKDLAKFRERFLNKPEIKAMAAATKAAAPYHLAMTRAQNTVAQYAAKAQSDMAQAKSLQAEALDLANKANAAASKTDARAYYEQAQAKAAEAAEYAANADNSFKTADQMNLDMPKFAGAAQAAAAKAAFDSMPAWQPAPPPVGIVR